MAGRFIAQMIVQGTTIFARAFVSAYQQAVHNGKTGGVNVTRSAKKFMHRNEALMILNLEEATLNRKALEEVYTRQFTVNDPGKGGSFYLQSKIYRANETLDRYLKRKESGLKDDDDGEDVKPKDSGGTSASSGAN